MCKSSLVGWCWFFEPCSTGQISTTRPWDAQSRWCVLLVVGQRRLSCREVCERCGTEGGVRPHMDEILELRLGSLEHSKVVDSGGHLQSGSADLHSNRQASLPGVWQVRCSGSADSVPTGVPALQLGLGWWLEERPGMTSQSRSPLPIFMQPLTRKRPTEPHFPPPPRAPPPNFQNITPKVGGRGYPWRSKIYSIYFSQAQCPWKLYFLHIEDL